MEYLFLILKIFQKIVIFQDILQTLVKRYTIDYDNKWLFLLDFLTFEQVNSLIIKQKIIQLNKKLRYVKSR